MIFVMLKTRPIKNLELETIVLMATVKLPTQSTNFMVVTTMGMNAMTSTMLPSGQEQLNERNIYKLLVST